MYVCEELKKCPEQNACEVVIKDQDKNCLVKGIVGTLYMYVVKKLLLVDLLFAVTGTCILQSLHGYLKIEKGNFNKTP